jgi:hypothetical protein
LVNDDRTLEDINGQVINASMALKNIQVSPMMCQGTTIVFVLRQWLLTLASCKARATCVIDHLTRPGVGSKVRLLRCTSDLMTGHCVRGEYRDPLPDGSYGLFAGWMTLHICHASSTPRVIFFSPFHAALMYVHNIGWLISTCV